MPTSPYDAFAEDYNWLFSDEHLSGERFLQLYRPVLDDLPAGGEILDCACGVGTEAIALARAGYKVTASDGSEGMVARARHNVAAAGLDIPLSHCRWDELPGRFEPRFDLAFCIGNSIAHSPGREAMLASLAAMSSVLVQGGRLVVESRDWERMREERQRFEVRENAPVRDGVRGFCVYVWTIPDRWEEDHVADVLVVLERDGAVSHHSTELRFMAYPRSELLASLAISGFEAMEVSEAGRGRYFVTARKAR